MFDRDCRLIILVTSLISFFILHLTEFLTNPVNIFIFIIILFFLLVFWLIKPYKKLDIREGEEIFDYWMLDMYPEIYENLHRRFYDKQLTGDKNAKKIK